MSGPAYRKLDVILSNESLKKKLSDLIETPEMQMLLDALQDENLPSSNYTLLSNVGNPEFFLSVEYSRLQGAISVLKKIRDFKYLTPSQPPAINSVKPKYNHK